MDLTNYNEALFQFLDKSPTAYHAVSNMAATLSKKGFVELKEGEAWQLESFSKYYVIRNSGALIAFYTGEYKPWETGIRICGAHTDSPALKVKPLPELEVGSTTRLGVEMYGGALLNSWFDRGLNLAGRVTVLLKNNCDGQKDGEKGEDSDNDEHKNFKAKGTIRTLLINFNRPVGIVPSLPIHLDREANSKRSVNVQVDMAPLVYLTNSDGSHGNDYHANGNTNGKKEEFSELKSLPSKLLKKVVLDQVGKAYSDLEIQDLFDFDLFFTEHLSPHYIGFNQEMISAPRLDNLLSCHAGLHGIAASKGAAMSLLYCADHEEVGSNTVGGAGGAFLNSILSRIIPDSENRYRTAAKSFMISLDNAHAVNPSHGERYDPTHAVMLNSGPVLKLNANMRYVSDCESSALFQVLCRRAGVPFQTFVMRSDMPCGSTIGPIVAASTGIKTVDVGAPTLGMHAIREITGNEDPHMIFRVLSAFFSTVEPPLLSLT